MIKSFFLLVLILFVISHLFSIQIEQIIDISNSELLFEYDVYSGAIKGFEDRIIMANRNSIEEFELFEDGSLNRLSHIETSTGYFPRLYIYQNILYYTNFRNNINTWFPNYFCRAFDLTQRPMVEIGEYELPEVVTGFVPSFNFHDSYIYVSFLGEQNFHITTKYCAETFTFIGHVVPALGGSWVRIEGNFLLNMHTTNDGYYRLMFYDFTDDQTTFQNDFVLPIHSEDGVGATYISETNYIFAHNGGVVMVDISDVMNPLLFADIRINTHGSYIWEAIYNGEYVVMSSMNKKLWVYQRNELDDFTFLWSNNEESFVTGTSRDIYVKDNIVFHQRGRDITAFNLHTSNELFRHNQNFNFFPLNSISPQKDDFYYNWTDWNTFSFDIYSVLENRLIVSVNNDYLYPQHTNHYQIKNEKLYIVLQRQNVYFFEIYDIIDEHAHIANSVQLSSPSDFFILTDSTLFIETNNSIEFFSIDGNQLIHLDSLIENLENRHTRHTYDFIITYLDRTVSFRDINDHNNVFFSALLPHAIGIISYIDDNYLLVYPPPPLETEITAYIYKYDLVENNISLFHTFLPQLGDTVSHFNGIVTDNAYWKENSNYFSILDNELVVIGEKQDKNRDVWRTFFYPEINKMVQVAMSGILVYDFDYTEYVSDGDIVIIPLKNELLGNYPNPFNPETTIHFNLQAETHVNIDIYNIRGQKVKSLVSEIKTSGKHQVIWKGTDENGLSVSSGIYFYKMQTSDFKGTKRMLLLK